jgi:hypothetical protein
MKHQGYIARIITHSGQEIRNEEKTNETDKRSARDRNAQHFLGLSGLLFPGARAPSPDFKVEPVPITPGCLQLGPNDIRTSRLPLTN